MRKGLILSTVFAALLGVGAVFGAHQGKAEVKSAEAASSEVTLYINHFDPGSDKGGSWSNFKYYLFGTGGNNGWPGQSFTDSMKTKTPNEFDQYQYVLTVDTSKYQSLVLTGNSDSSWGGAFAKTEDFSITSVTSSNNGLYCGAHKGWQTDANVFAVGTYSYTTKTVYMLDLKGDVYTSKHYCHTFATGHVGTTWPGVEMTKVSGSKNLYSVEINSNLDNVIFNNNGGNQTNTITSVAGNDAYVVYPDNGYNKLTLAAASFIDQYMKFETKWLDDEGDGSCKSAGWYSSAKTAFNGKSAQEKQDILAHEPTSYRLAAWAKANGDKLSESNVLVKAAGTFGYETSIEENSSILVIVFAAISVMAFATLLIVKKKRHN